jgi:hypothetical protein
MGKEIKKLEEMLNRCVKIRDKYVKADQYEGICIFGTDENSNL